MAQLQASLTEADLAVAATRGSVVQTLFDLIPAVHNVHGKRVGAQLEAILKLAFLKRGNARVEQFAVSKRVGVYSVCDIEACRWGKAP